MKKTIDGTSIRMQSIVQSTNGGTYPDGTIKGDSSGAEAFGFNTARETTESAVRGSDLPTGTKNTIGIVPMEYVVINESTQMFTTYDITNTNFDAKVIKDSKLRVSTAGYGRANMAKAVKADINGDGKDEIVYFSANIANDLYLNLKIELRVDIINYNGEKMHGASINLTSVTDGGKFLDSLASQNYASVMQVTSGDFDGDGKDEVAVYIPYLGEFLPETQNIMIFDYSAEYNNFYMAYSSKLVPNYKMKYNAVCITAGDCDNDGLDEVLVTYDNGIEAGDYYKGLNKSSFLSVFHYDKSTKKYKEELLGEILLGDHKDPLGYAGVTVGDVDNDGFNEIIVGGYMVNYNSTTNTLNYKGKNIAYFHEMAMAYMDYNYQQQKATGVWKGFTVLRDDEGMAATQGAALNNHNSKDTSLYWNDEDDRTATGTKAEKDRGNGVGMCHSPVTADWTIPIKAVSLSGHQNGKTYHQVFFSMWFYQFSNNTGFFEVYDKAPAYQNVNNNNVVISELSAGSFQGGVGSVDTSKLDGKEQLFMVLSREEKSKKSTSIIYESYIYSRSGVSVTRLAKTIGSKRPDSEDRCNHFICCSANIDDDAVYIRFKAHEFVFAEPYISAVIVAPPYFDDIKQLTSGYSSGSTTLVDMSGESTETGQSANISYGAGASYKGLFWGISGGLTEELSWSWKNTISTEYQYMFTATQDTVLLTCVPTDLYLYEVLEPGSKTWAPMVTSVPCQPVQQKILLKKYEECLPRYNAIVDEHNKTYGSVCHLNKLPSVSDFVTHIVGDPATYYNSTNQFRHVYKDKILTGNFTGTDYTGGSTTTVITEKTQDTTVFSWNVKVNVKPTLVFFEYNIGGGYSESTTETSYVGTSYKGEIKDLPAQYQGKYYYQSSLTAYTAALDTYSDVEKNNRFILIDYMVNHVNALPKLVNNFCCKENTSHSITLGWDFPKITSSVILVDKYDLYRYNSKENKWELLKSYTEAAAGETGVTYTDSNGISPNTAYRYKLVSSRKDYKDTNEIELTVNSAKAVTYTVSYEDGVHGAVSGKIYTSNNYIIGFETGKAIDEGSKLVFTAVPDDGYQVEDWSVTGMDRSECVMDSERNTLTIPSLKSEITIYPLYVQKLAKVVCTVEPNAYEGQGDDCWGNVSAAYEENGQKIVIAAGEEALVPYKTTVTFTAEPMSGYQVLTWSLNSETICNIDGSAYTGQNNCTTFVLDDMDVKVIFGRLK